MERTELRIRLLALGLLTLGWTLAVALAGTAHAQTPDVGAVGAAMRTERDVVYRPGGDPDGKDKLDLYVPPGPGPHPVIVFIHGGGLLQGDKSIFAGLGQYFVRRGFAAAIVNHRLSPGVSHPAHIQDAAAAFAWVYRNVERFGGDPKRIILAGHSSGAYLAALLATDPRWLGAHDLDSSAIRGVVPISGFYDVELLAPTRPMSVWGKDPAVWREASPIRHVRRDAPPMLLLYADGDDDARRAESRSFEQALADAGQANVKSVQIPERDHRSIIARFGERDDETSTRLLEFARGLVGEPAGKAAQAPN